MSEVGLQRQKRSSETGSYGLVLIESLFCSVVQFFRSQLFTEHSGYVIVLAPYPGFILP